MATLSEDPVWFLYCSFEFYGKPPGETRRGVAVAWRRFSSPVWMMAVKDGFCYFLIQKKFQLNTHFYVQKQVWCLGHFESTLARPRGLMREDSRPVHGRPLKSVTVVILDTEAVSNRLVCVRGESFPETAEIEEKCN